MRRIIPVIRFSFAKYTEANPELGLIGEPKDLRGMEVDKFRRFFTRVHLHHAGKQSPNFEAQRHDLPTLQRNEIQTRILRVIRDLQILEVKDVKFEADLRRDLKIDSLNMVALLTSIEHQFTTVFQDDVFEGLRNLNEVVTILMRDQKII